MVLNTFTVVLLSVAIDNVLLQSNDIDSISIVSTSQRPLDTDDNLANRVARIELQLEMRTVLNELKESITHLQNIKQEIVDEIDTVLQKKLKFYDADLKNQLSATKKNIITETEHAIKQYLSTASFGISDQVCANLTKLVNSEAEKRRTNDIQTLFDEIILSGEISDIKSELAKARDEIRSDMRECQALPSDCGEVLKRGYNASGIYRVQPMLALQDFLVWCDMSTRGGGWTYVINRGDGSQNFYRNWGDYKAGFGNLTGEHWLGLDHLYELTNSKTMQLLFELVDWDSNMVYALYDDFRVAGESDSYRINSLGNYSGDAGDSFTAHNSAGFSTVDNEHSHDCAKYFEGSWWYTSCYEAHLTGKYVHNPIPGTYYKSGIKWNTINGTSSILKEARMMIRPVYS